MKKFLKELTVGMCILTLAGCSTGADGRNGEKDMAVTEQRQTDMPLKEDETDKIAHGMDDAEDNGGKEEFLPNESRESASGTAGTSTEDQNEKVDADSLYASAAIIGSVVDFSEESCTVSAAVTEDDGKTGVIAASGYESEDTNVVVTYQEDCVVWIATIYTSTGIAELEQATLADIKKQAGIIIYGDFEDAHHVSATGIVICHRTA